MELNFFIEEANWNRGVDWYRSQFSPREEGQRAGDASPWYSTFPVYAGTPERIATTVPDVKIIYLIREPIDRIVSSWVENRARGYDSLPMQEAILTDVRYICPSQYATQLERYLEYFDRSAILVLRTEDLAKDTVKVVADACSFIGVDPHNTSIDPDEWHNISSAKVVPRHRTVMARNVLSRLNRPNLAKKVVSANLSFTHRALRPEELHVDDDLRERLRTYLLPEMSRLRKIVGPEMDLWGYA
jgi:hypothetical protein